MKIPKIFDILFKIGCVAKDGIFLDGRHGIIARIATGTSMVELEKSVFRVTDRDVYGLLYLKQTAFTATLAFEVSQYQ